jgi:hypothetical protein
MVSFVNLFVYYVLQQSHDSTVHYICLCNCLFERSGTLVYNTVKVWEFWEVKREIYFILI